MKLEDWPIFEESYDPGVWCGARRGGGEVERRCNVALEFEKYGSTFGDLARSIVEHAREEHGVELERSGSWYESYAPDGKLWMGSSNVEDFMPADTEGMEGEELEYWTKRNKAIGMLTYRRIDSYIVDVLDEGWKP